MKQRLHLIYIAPSKNTFVERFNLCTPKYRNAANSKFELAGWPSPIYAPYCITYYLANRLCSQFDVKVYDWNETCRFTASKSDIILCHPKVIVEKNGKITLDFESISWRALSEASGARKILFMPYVPGADDLWLPQALAAANGEMVAITGLVWMKDFAAGPTSQLTKRFLRLDMGIEGQDYPRVKTTFNPPGKRKFLYIGHTADYKNTQMLEGIAATLPKFEGGHIGFGRIAGWKHLGSQIDLTPESMRVLAKEYDIFVSVSTGDAQATTILEQICFGLAIACTPETGYTFESLYRLDCKDLDLNVKILSELQRASEGQLLKHCEDNLRHVVEFHNWKDFADRVVKFINPS